LNDHSRICTVLLLCFSNQLASQDHWTISLRQELADCKYEALVLSAAKVVSRALKQNTRLPANKNERSRETWSQ
jgi:hypothetical protein